jgi:hypothetical protein
MVKKSTYTYFSVFMLLFSAGTVLASQFSNGLEQTGALTGHPTNLNPAETIGRVIYMLLGFLGIAFLVLMIYGGYTWMLARGNETEVEKAKSIIRNTIIGIIIILSAYGITYLFMNGLTSQVTTTGT